MAAGVASPTAHGQDITRIVMAISREKRNGVSTLEKGQIRIDLTLGLCGATCTVCL